MYTLARQFGNLSALKWCKTMGVPFSDRLAEILNKVLECLQWLQALRTNSDSDSDADADSDADTASAGNSCS